MRSARRSARARARASFGLLRARLDADDLGVQEFHGLLDERVFGDALLCAGCVGEGDLGCFDAEGDIRARGSLGEGFDLGQVRVEGRGDVGGNVDGDDVVGEGDGRGGVEECAQAAVGRGEGEQARPEFFEGCGRGCGC